MTNTALAFDQNPPVLEALAEQFSDAELERLLGLPSETVPWAVWDQSLYGPLADFLSRPGKEFRARLVDLAWEMAGKRGAPPPELRLVVEVLHAGSLIVDDIEDDSTYRRGELALHKKWGLPRALNAGSWLYFWPDVLIERMQLAPPVELGVRRLLDRTLLRAHHGQALDLSTRVFDLAQRDVPSVVSVTTRLKTGALMQLAVELGAVSAGAPRPLVAALGSFGQRLGTALQMLDDLGGIVSEKRCHKGHEDLLGGRPTWPFAWVARQLDPMHYGKLVILARQVHRRDAHPEELAEQLRELIAKSGRDEVSRHMEQTFADLEAVVGHVPALADVKAEIDLIGRSYG
ncbi:MAG: polyprenyl synthetase family protein [Myxococcales bacterium]|nr:polyprenyl synthetase family protein [Myxococcales bacterium]